MNNTEWLAREIAKDRLNFDLDNFKTPFKVAKSILKGLSERGVVQLDDEQVLPDAVLEHSSFCRDECHYIERDHLIYNGFKRVKPLIGEDE